MQAGYYFAGYLLAYIRLLVGVDTEDMLVHLVFKHESFAASRAVERLAFLWGVL